MKLNANVPLEHDVGFLERYAKNQGRRYVYGRTKEAEYFIKAISCDYVIDDFTDERFFCGKEIVRLDDVPSGSSVLSAVIHSPVTIYKLLKNKELDFSSYYWVQANEGKELPDIEYWKGARGHFRSNQIRYDQLYQDLCDSESCRTLIDLISFRETGNLRNMLAYSNRLSEMYFEDFFSLPQGASFYDLGALDGKNSLDFINKYPGYSALLLVEPLPEYAGKLRSFWNSLKGTVYECAISSADGFSGFKVSDCNAASSLSENDGGITVEIKTIDGIYREAHIPPSFIKMDIEGAEIEALKGGEGVIREFMPVLAVSVYHNPSHILEAYEFIKRVAPDYKFFMRHYTEGFAETVLFAVI